MEHDEPSAANRIAEAGKLPPPPGHPAANDSALPSAGEQLSRATENVGADSVPGDEVLLAEDNGATESPTEHMPG